MSVRIGVSIGVMVVVAAGFVGCGESPVGGEVKTPIEDASVSSARGSAASGITLELSQTALRPGGDFYLRVVAPEGGEARHGIDSVLEEQDENGDWQPAYTMLFSYSDGEPGSAPSDGAIAVIAIGLFGDEWRRLRIPADAPPGRYRIALDVNDRPRYAELTVSETAPVQPSALELDVPSVSVVAESGTKELAPGGGCFRTTTAAGIGQTRCSASVPFRQREDLPEVLVGSDEIVRFQFDDRPTRLPDFSRAFPSPSSSRLTGTRAEPRWRARGRSGVFVLDVRSDERQLKYLVRIKIQAR